MIGDRFLRTVAVFLRGALMGMVLIGGVVLLFGLVVALVGTLGAALFGPPGGIGGALLGLAGCIGGCMAITLNDCGDTMEKAVGNYVRTGSFKATKTR